MERLSCDGGKGEIEGEKRESSKIGRNERKSETKQEQINLEQEEERGPFISCRNIGF